jgi:RimJ/RimL family protein N-acetyltransferase
VELDGIDLITEAVRGTRVLLRPFRPDDVDTAYRACQDADLQRWLTALPSPYTRESAVEFVTGIAPRGRAAGTDLGCAIEVDGEMVGSCGAHHLTSGRLGPEIGSRMHTPGSFPDGPVQAPAQGPGPSLRGLGGAGVLLLFTDVDNSASQAVAVRAGFTAEGTVRSCLEYRDGSRADALLFGRLAGA